MEVIMPPYLSITTDIEHELIIKKSRFITNLKRVTTEDEAIAFINQIKKQHYKANHNCSAFMIGEQHQIQRMSDDGEPSGTAGNPMLEVLKRNDVHNVVAVVTRYFGGIKLGAGGLIRAYAGAVAQAIETVGLVERLNMNNVTLTIEYAQLDKINYWLITNNYPLPTAVYTDHVTLTLPIRATDIAFFKDSLNTLLKQNIALSVDEATFQEIPYHKVE